MPKKLWFKRKYYNSLKGFNNRIDNIQAAFLIEKLKKLNKWNKKEKKLLAYINEPKSLDSKEESYCNILGIYLLD